MVDMTKTVEPKSSQINYDDFPAGQSKTIKITKVSGVSGEQPIAINYEGDNGKPYMPCKSMRRVLVNCWGIDGHAYVGRYLTLYGDPSVKFGGLAVGGIRISHMSHIPETVTMALTATRASRKPFTVQPLEIPSEIPKPSLDDALSDIATAPTAEGLEFKFKAAYKAFKDEESRAKLVAAKDKRKEELTTKEEAP